MQKNYVPSDVELLAMQLGSIKRLSAFNEIAYRRDARKYLERLEEQRLKDLDSTTPRY